MDSGAGKSLIRTSTAQAAGLVTQSSTQVTYIKGFSGETVSTNQYTSIGTMEALVSPELAADLVSVNPLVDSGLTVTLDRHGGCICNKATGYCIPVHRTDTRWTVWLSDIARVTSDTSNVLTQSTDAMYCHQCEDSTTNANSIDAYAARTVPITPTIRQLVIQLHNAMGHQNAATMCQAVSGQNPTWKQHPDRKVTASQIRKVFKKYTCVDCVLAKRNLAGPGLEYEDISGYLPGEVISADPVGKISPPTREGHQWLFLFKCMGTGRVHTFTAKTKDAFPDAFRQVYDYYTTHGHKPKVLRTDYEKLLDSTEIREALRERHMVSQHSAPYRHFQNSVEREVQTYVKGIALLLHSQQWLQSDQWDLAAHHFGDVRNNTPNVHDRLRSPEHRITGNPTDVSKRFQFAFGDLLAVGIPKELRRWKFDLRNDIGVYVGQPPGVVDAANVYYPDTGQILTRGSLYKLEISDESVLKYFQRRKDMRETTLTSRSFQDALADIDFDTLVETEGQVTEASASSLPNLSMPLSDDDIHLPAPVQRVPATKTVIPSDRVLRSQSKTATTYSAQIHYDLAAMNASLSTNAPAAPTVPTVSDDDVMSHLHYAAHAYAAKITTKRALSSSDRDKWIEALKAEIDQLFAGTLLEESPVGVRGVDYVLIHSTMQLKIKLKSDMTIEKYKARLCARGDMLSGIILETYSPTISSLARATAHQLAILDGMHTCIVDTVGAYLYQDYPSTATPLYLKLEPHVATALGLNPDATYRIKKYLYGLPDSGRAYYHAYSEHLTNEGYKRTLSDPCLFTKLTETSRTYVWIHVDDTFVASTDTKELELFQQVIGKKYKYTVQQDVESYLGIAMTRLADGTVRLTQPKLLAELFTEHDEVLRTCRKVNTPHSGSNEESPDWDSTPMDRTKYLHLLGALLYITTSRPDIATAVSFAATHSVKPSEGAYRELLRCVQYLYNTQDVGLVLHPGRTPSDDLVLRCYVDASYLTHSDSKSHTGYCLSFGTIGTFYSKSTKQTLVHTSSTHAEMRALYQAILDIIFVVTLCEELGRPITLPAIVMEDNQPVIDLTSDISSRAKKCKHFLMLVNYVREQVQSGLIELRKVATEDNVADVLTKILKGSMFTEKAEQLLGLKHFADAAKE